METVASVIVSQMVQFVILILMGFIYTKLKVFNENGLNVLSKFVINIAMPAYIVAAIPVSTTRTMLVEAFPFFLACVVAYLIMIFCGYLTGKLLKFPPNTLRIHIVQYGFGNYGLIGVQLIMATFGPASSVYVAIIFLVDQMILWTIGPPLSYGVDKKNEFDLKVFKNLLNPTMVAVILAIIMVLVEYNPDNILFTTFEGIGSTAKYLAMVFIGGMLAGLDIKKITNVKGLIVIILCKMVATPLFVFFVTGGLTNYLDYTARVALMLLTALPSLFVMTMLAKINGSDYEYATMTVFLTTICSVITIPLVVYLGSFIS